MPEKKWHQLVILFMYHDPLEHSRGLLSG